MNQFSNTQRSVTTAGYDELRYSSLSIKLSPFNFHTFSCPTPFHSQIAVCVFWLLFVCIHLSVWKVTEQYKYWVFIGLGTVNVSLSTE
jgi:hypothetical protein